MIRYQEIAQLLDANAITNVVDGYEKGRADAIDEFCELLISETCQECKECNPRKATKEIVCREQGYVKFYMRLAEQLKEQTNDQKRESNTAGNTSAGV